MSPKRLDPTSRRAKVTHALETLFFLEHPEAREDEALSVAFITLGNGNSYGLIFDYGTEPRKDVADFQHHLQRVFGKGAVTEISADDLRGVSAMVSPHQLDAINLDTKSVIDVSYFTKDKAYEYVREHMKNAQLIMRLFNTVKQEGDKIMGDISTGIISLVTHKNLQAFDLFRKAHHRIKAETPENAMAISQDGEHEYISVDTGRLKNPAIKKVFEDLADQLEQRNQRNTGRT